MSSPHFSVIIVTWHPGAELESCVASLAAARRLAERRNLLVELVLVDNASPEFPHEVLNRHWPDARTLWNDSNRGFGPAANQGFQACRAPYVLLLNPDTCAVDDPFSILHDGFERLPDVVALAPRLLEDGTPTGESQASFQLRRLPTWGQAVRELLLVDKMWPNNRFLIRDRYLDRDRSTSFPVEQPAAAALAMRRETLIRCGGFDERFIPAWFEDVDLCERLGRTGDLLYWPDACFLHRGGVAAHRLGYDQFLPIYYANAIRYRKKHSGAMAVILYRLLVATGMLMRLASLPLRKQLPRSRSESARAYVRAFGGALSSR